MEKINKIQVNGVTYEIGGTGGEIIETTYSELKSLMSSSSLIAGNKYRITDYVTKFKTIGSANHQFDIVVEALTSNTLSENASAMLHEGDDYFSNASIDTWKLSYSFENDTARFKEASEEGKGFIYKMVDEYDNEANYDFKNALFYLPSSDHSFGTSSQEVLFYTFSYISKETPDSQEYIKDKTIHQPGTVSNNKIITDLSETFKYVLGARAYDLESLLKIKNKIKNNVVNTNNVVACISSQGIYLSDNLFYSQFYSKNYLDFVNNCIFKGYSSEKIELDGTFYIENSSFSSITELKSSKSESINIIDSEFRSSFQGTKLELSDDIRSSLIYSESTDPNSILKIEEPLKMVSFYSKETSSGVFETRKVDPFA